MGFLEKGILRQGGGAVAHSVRLYVGFVYHVKAVAVAELIPARVVGIVAGAYCVDTQLLHYADVAQHLLRSHAVGAVGAHFVTVHALDEYRLPVHQQL